MANITTFLENKLLAHSLGVEAWTKPTKTYAALYTASPTTSSLGTEVASTNNYQRLEIAWGTAANGIIANSSALAWSATGAWSAGSSIKAIGILTSGTYGAGDLLYYGPLSTSITMNTGDTFNIPVSKLAVTIT